MASVKKLRYYAGGWKESKTSKWMDCYDPSTGEVIAQAPQCTPAEVEEAIQAAAAAFPAWSDHPGEPARPGALPDEGAHGQAPRRADPALREGARQGARRGHGRRGQGDRAGRVRLRHPAPDEGSRQHERHVRLRHHPVHGADGRVRGHRALELPRHAPHGLDGADLHRHRQHPRAEARELRSPVAPCASWSCGRRRACRRVSSTSSPARGTRPRSSCATPTSRAYRSSGRPPSASTSTPRPRPTASGCRPSPRRRTTPWSCTTRPSSARPGASWPPPAAARASAAWPCPRWSSRSRWPTSWSPCSRR